VEKAELEHALLSEGAHFNFPKMHLISHFPDQISKFGSLPQFSTEICEASHKPLKTAYRRSNHKNALPQIIDTYTRTHNFGMREQNIIQWSEELDTIPGDILRVLRPSPTLGGIHIPCGAPPSCISTKLKGRINPKTVFNLKTLATYYHLPDLQALTTLFLMNNIYNASPDPTSDAAHLVDAPLDAFHTLQMAVKTFDDNGYILHKLRCTGSQSFQKQGPRNDWVFVRRHPPAPNKIPGSLDGRVPAQLNTVFRLQNPGARTFYDLAHISLLKVIGSQTPDGYEGMARVGSPMKNHVIKISDIEGMAHLIPIETDHLYLVNNRIDQHTWNDIHDGN
jgi:hypothetical protein